MIGNSKQVIQWLCLQDNEKRFKIEEYKGKRNKDQNSKYWKLLYELANVLKISVEELHFKMLKEYSIRYQILVPENQILRGIEYYEKKSIIKKDNKLWEVYYIYTPSHELNTKEFAYLLNGLCEECKEVGIETLSPDELLELKEIIEN